MNYPVKTRIMAFGVGYDHYTYDDGGELFVTPLGQSWAHALQPEVWHKDERYHKEGQRLAGSTGTVYRLKLSSPEAPRIELVIKFSRFGEHVPLFVPDTLPRDFPDQLIDLVRFNSPFEEFGLIAELRRGLFGPSRLRIQTKRPLAIYVTPERRPLWQLGRTEGKFFEHEVALRADQASRHLAERVEFDIGRQYIMLYGWVRGENAEDIHAGGLLGEAELEQLTLRVNRELAAKGFRILDNKPKHIILRRRPDGSLLRRGGELTYVQVDFELLQRTGEYLAYLSGGAHI